MNQNDKTNNTGKSYESDKQLKQNKAIACIGPEVVPN